MKILITGATGFIGKEVCKALALRGHEIIALTRKPELSRTQIPAPHQAVAWSHETQSLDDSDLQSIRQAGAVIHLAGESIAQQRWSDEYKNQIMTSRVKGTESLVRLLQSASHPGPRVWISASAIGYYGEHGNEAIDESTPAGSDFLAQVCQKWENALFEAPLPETRKVALRFGVVLGRAGGALEKMIPPFLSGLGATLGSGKQWMSWIHLHDLVEVILKALEDSRYEGAINVCSPEPVTQGEFTRVLGRVLKRRSFFKAPSSVLKLALGSFATTLLASQKVLPRKLQELGFEFQNGHLEEALFDLLGDSYAQGHSEFLASCWIDQPIEKVFAFFSQAENLERITPPWLHFKILHQSTPAIEKGTLIDYQLKLHGVPLRWRTEISEWNPPFQFIDLQLKGPYHLWKHTHRFTSLGGGTLIEDRVLFELPLGSLGRIAAGSYVLKDVKSIFSYRSQKIFELLA